MCVIPPRTLSQVSCHTTTMSETTDRAAVVEDIPSHELYAEILGISCPVKSSMPQQGGRRGEENEARTAPDVDNSRRLPIVAPIEEEAEPGKSGEFGRFYKKSLQKKGQMSSLLLDTSNKGFKLLSRMGWKESDGGLGRRRQGSMVPVKTVLKADKKGLGAGNRVAARITHPARAKSDSDSSEKGKKETKGQRRKRKQEEKDRETRKAKQARMLLRTDVSDEYEQLYLQLHS